MGLIVLALRSYLVFQNVYQTFKTLKTPPPSARTGRPSIRVMTQRKRDMKGCMAVWIVWCCLSAYEATVESIISIFIPFYDEIKSVILVFLLLSRARGAEPIYLHVIRPLVKPYVSTLDSILDLIHNVGDFVLLVVSIPFYPLIAWYRGSFKKSPETTYSEIDSDADAYSVVGSSIYANGNGTTKALCGTPPAPPSDEDEPSSAGLPPPMPTSQTSVAADISQETVIDEWRAYPPFPAAYPPTPLPATSRLAMPEPEYAVEQTRFTSITEEAIDFYGRVPGSEQPGGRVDDDKQHFQRSLLPPREPANPGSDGGLSDDIIMSGVQDKVKEMVYIISDDDDDDEYVDEEDDFNVTLQTPPPRQMMSRYAYPMTRERSNLSIATVATIASSSGTSAPSEDATTALTTVGHSSSLRTGTLSGSSSASNADASSLAGKKRPWSRSNIDALTRIRAMGQLSPNKHGKRHFNTTRLRPMVSKSSSLRANWDGTASEEASNTDEDEEIGEDGESEMSSSASKRRKVVDVGPRDTESKTARTNGNGTIRAKPVPNRTSAGTSEAGARTKAQIARPPTSTRLVSTRTSLRAAHARTAVPRPPALSSATNGNGASIPKARVTTRPSGGKTVPARP
ncbi:hypothetical protein EW146_g10097 [Bondarzewia mesenterica]|uniref:Protein YOP1 n=1 Tax=Bondarzewia mesenterica TaxID=1095465 RepID=A0A4S4L0N6_9AGAM|nr:hypothetical protein EW146_g10097 [Bondarzewia mesenterica]